MGEPQHTKPSWAKFPGVRNSTLGLSVGLWPCVHCLHFSFLFVLKSDAMTYNPRQTTKVKSCFFMRISKNTANLEGRQDSHLQGCSPQTLGLLTKTEQRSPFLEPLLSRGRFEMSGNVFYRAWAQWEWGKVCHTSQVRNMKDKENGHH